MAGAVYGEDPITLGSLGNWLVLLPDENPANPPPRINRGQVQQSRELGHAHRGTRLTVLLVVHWLNDSDAITTLRSFCKGHRRSRR